MSIRTITALILIVIIFPLIYLGGYYLDGLIFFMMAVLAYEVSRLKKFKYPNLLMVFIYVVVIGLFFCLPAYLFFYLGCVAMVTFTFPIIDNEFTLFDVVAVFTMIFLAAMAIIGIRNLRAFSLALTFLVVFANSITDSFAYFVGSFIGKHKLAPKISPKKTIEGSVGGWFGGAMCVILCRYILYPKMSIVLMIVLALILPIVTQLGDLAFSMIKRAYNVKDFGKIFGEHGGIFDRIDSLIFALILINFLLSIGI